MEEDLKNINKDKKEGIALSRDLADLEQKATEQVLERLGYVRDIKQELLDLLGVNTKRSQDEKDILSIAGKIAQSARENNQELRETGRLANRLAADRNIEKKLTSEIELIKSTALPKSIAGADKIRELNLKRLEAEEKIAEYQDKFEKAQGASRGGYASALKAQQAIRDQIEEQLLATIKGADADAQKIAVLLQLKDALQGIILDREEEVEKQNKVNSAMGITGALLENINKIGIRAFGGLGLNLAAFGTELGKARQDVEDMAAELALTEAGKGMSDFQKRIVSMRASFPGVRKAVISAFNDPLSIAIGLFSSIFSSVSEVNKATVELARLNGDVNRAGLTYNTTLATTLESLKVAGELTQQFGLRAQAVFSPNVIASAAEFKKMLGLSAEEAGNLALFSQLTGQSLDKAGKSIINQVNNFNRANKSAISQGIILRDVGKASDGITASLGVQPDLIAAAATAARRLGIELKELDSIANSLLDFESSIESELEAQLLTGNQINLNKARELALTNDLAGLGEEIFKNTVTLTEFGQLNRIQQEAQAKALGMTRDQLARTAFLRALELGMSEEQASIAASVNLEEMKRLSIQESISTSIDKITQQLAGPLELVAALASNAGVFYTTLALIGGIGLAKLILQFASLSATLAAAAVSSVTLTSALTVGLGAAAIIAAIIGITAAMKSARESAVPTIQDGIIDPNQGLVVSGPKGSIQLDKDDTVIAGTNLNRSSNSSRETMETNNLLRELITMVGRGGNVYIDGNIAGQALVLADSKSS